MTNCDHACQQYGCRVHAGCQTVGSGTQNQSDKTQVLKPDTSVLSYSPSPCYYREIIDKLLLLGIPKHTYNEIACPFLEQCENCDLDPCLVGSMARQLCYVCLLTLFCVSTVL